ncbi:hypothetical protein PAQ31011_03049 [Pandoraea aquatica]|uniref:IPT/TIG domain-containing protein n=1 Tax=Pandoraea aquatica TaxID=2508290 RepID=A0A5E4W251_9BURK|nr:IPT/TIG domain-containing protein [Pandoraea aquatica]VVE19007.1 hypothetical protein PAQ31011_03049 [Pandoraea aquatica]
MPNMTNVDASQLSRAGGMPFTITGTGFSKTVEVFFLDEADLKIPASSFKVESDSRITGICPAFPREGPVTINVAVGDDATPAKVASGTAAGINQLSPYKLEYVNEFFVVAVSPSGLV